MWNKPLQESSPLPLWFQIAERLRQAIADGTFAAGDALPSESQLNEVFGISRATSRTALDSLEQEGLIVRKSGRGSIVLAPRVEQPAMEMYGFSEDMRQRGLRPSYQTIFAGRARANVEVSEALGIRVNSPIYHSRRVLRADEQPVGLALSWLPLGIFGEVAPPTIEELNSNSLYRWLNEKCGVKVAGARETIEATQAEADAAAQLELVAGAALLVVRRRSDTAEGLPVEYAILLFRSDRYRLHLETGLLGRERS
ncbi:GntR family transcriptional regulator [Mesorhizobium marinum]|uniref:GntR family transcriptional regulator n=1 Tax=Mesorhizobium marinum TaxID=3228790 RepID=A0ABV3QUC7_9HYPH